MWSNLTLNDKARIINLAVKSGITDLKTIEEVYNKTLENKYESGGHIYDGNTENTQQMSVWDKIKNGFTQATLKAAMADSPAVMQASGWDYDKNNKLYQGDHNSKGASQLVKNLVTTLTTTSYSNNKELNNKEFMYPIWDPKSNLSLSWDTEPALVNYQELKNRQKYAESFGRAKAVSKAGAKGLFQIMPATLEDYIAATGETGDLFDPIFNEKVRDWKMDMLAQSEFVTKGNPSDSVKFAKQLAAYNYGSTNLVRVLNKAKEDNIDIYNSLDWLEYLPQETRDYVNFILLNKDVGGSKTNAKYDIYKKLTK